MSAPTVTIGKVTATLVPPRPAIALALTRSEDEQATDGWEVSAFIGAAALSACWPPKVAWPAGPRPARWQPGERVERYGGLVFDDLIEFGISVYDLLGAHDADKVWQPGPMEIAHRWALESRLSAKEVRAAEDFSGPPTGG